MAYVGFNPQNIPVPPYYNQPNYYPPMPPAPTVPVEDSAEGVTPPMPPMPPVPPRPPVPHPPVPPAPPYGPHGKLPVDGFLINYEGLDTDTAQVHVDNRHRTISVDVLKQGVDNTFEYATATPMASWEIVHNMNKYPAVTVTDWYRNVILADVRYIDKNTVVVTLSEPICGRAFLN